LVPQHSMQSSLEVFFVSDRTGITAEALGRSLLTQFDEDNRNYTVLPYIDTAEKIAAAIEQIHAVKENSGHVIVFSTLSNENHRQQLINNDFFVLDLFASCLPPLQSALQQQTSPAIGQTHGIRDHEQYLTRMEAVNFALNVDDGLQTKNYQQAEIILIGVSRSGKTPTCLYLAMQFGIRAANYPLLEEDLEGGHLPTVMKPWKNKLYGLVIDPDSLHRIRQARLPDSRYASLEQCRKEIKLLQNIYRQEQVTVVESSNMSVEELATSLMHKAGLRRQF
jgi:regulator of PEP synthase PpsR (kinase-PPPase family)